MMLQRKKKIRRIRHLKTNTGDNYSVTVSKESSSVFSGCCLYEEITEQGIYFKSGCVPNEK
jgi:hypothetical protein